MQPNQRRLNPIAVLVLVVALGLIGFVGWYAHGAHTKTSPMPTPIASRPPSGGATYDHGQPVPADSQARAKAAGYYCPSWDAKPGQNSVDICVSLDK